MPSKFPSFQEGDKRGIFPVITKHRGKYIVLTSHTSESMPFNTIAQANQFIQAVKFQQRPTKKKKTTRKKNKGFFDW
jgi:hypothetical protein